jgi:hypothetical protein
MMLMATAHSGSCVNAKVFRNRAEVEDFVTGAFPWVFRLVSRFMEEHVPESRAGSRFTRACCRRTLRRQRARASRVVATPLRRWCSSKVGIPARQVYAEIRRTMVATTPGPASDDDDEATGSGSSSGGGSSGGS